MKKIRLLALVLTLAIAPAACTTDFMGPHTPDNGQHNPDPGQHNPDPGQHNPDPGQHNPDNGS